MPLFYYKWGMGRFWPYILGFTLLAGCTTADEPVVVLPPPAGMSDTIGTRSLPSLAGDTMVYENAVAVQINTGSVRPEAVVAFARTLTGIPYQYASCDPKSGFDCSGFVYYVFDHFGISVPRSSADFTKLGREVPQQEARPGDLILFTGTDSSQRTVGHMGIVVSDSLDFMHSSSGKANGVTTTRLDNYYQGRFMKVIRIFKQNEEARQTPGAGR